MGVPPDFLVKRYLEARADARFADTPLNKALVGLYMNGADDETIDRIWDSVKGDSPTIIEGYGVGAPPEPPIWVVLLKTETPDRVRLGHRTWQKEPKTVNDGVDDHLFTVLGGPWKQTVQLQVYTVNPEATRYHYVIMQSLMYEAAYNLMGAQLVAAVEPLNGGDFRPLPELHPAGYSIRFADWSFTYTMRAFAERDPLPNEIEVQRTPTGSVEV